MHTDRVDFLDLKFDRLTFSQVKNRLRTVTAATPYGYIVTPNVDHIVRLRREPELRPLYEGAQLCLCDSRVLRLLARLIGIRLPLVAGSDLAATLMKEVIKAGDRVAVVGATPEFLHRLRDRYLGVEFLHHAPPMGLRGNAQARNEAAAFVASAKARFSFITVGSPQQEMIAHEAGALSGASGIALCIGAGLEFLTGDQKRAPRLMRRLGLEWAHRLATNPRRLARRYLIEGPAIFPIYVRWALLGSRKWWAAGVMFAGAIAVGLIVRETVFGSNKQSTVQAGASRAMLPGSASQPLGLPPPDLLRPLSPQEASKENAERPFVKRPDSAAAKFVLKTASDDRERALTCLAQAVYYEAAGEGSDGERAVAQVVINRMRHPGYPASICGVVYQGSDRGTGCQFTFTCNGSLLQAPAADLWARARKIAQDALSGKVFAPIGHATHYHAEYVLPYWADSLDKSVQIGRHIFYRLRGILGEKSAFSQHYAGTEPVVHPPNAAVILPESAAEQLAGALINDNVNGPAKNVEKAGQPATPPLAADLGRGSLIIDGQTPAAVPAHSPKQSNDCQATAENSKQLSPLGRADLRAGGGAAAPGC